MSHEDSKNDGLKIMSNAAKNFDILATNLNVLHKYFDGSIKVQQNYFSVFT